MIFDIMSVTYVTSDQRDPKMIPLHLILLQLPKDAQADFYASSCMISWPLQTDILSLKKNNPYKNKKSGQKTGF